MFFSILERGKHNVAKLGSKGNIQVDAKSVDTRACVGFALSRNFGTCAEIEFGEAMEVLDLQSARGKAESRTAWLVSWQV